MLVFITPQTHSAAPLEASFKACAWPSALLISCQALQSSTQGLGSHLLQSLAASILTHAHLPPDSSYVLFLSLPHIHEFFRIPACQGSAGSLGFRLFPFIFLSLQKPHGQSPGWCWEPAQEPQQRKNAIAWQLCGLHRLLAMAC